MSILGWGTWGPQLTVELGISTTASSFAIWDVSAWDGAAGWGPDVVWTDITAYARKMTISTGNSRATEYFRAPVGSMTAILDNRDDRFSPVNLSGPYVSAGVTQIRPRVPIRVRAGLHLVGESTYDWSLTLFYGYVDVWQDQFPGSKDATTYIECSDVLSVLARFNGAEQPTQGAGDTIGARVTRIAQNAGFTGTISVTGGNVPLQATTLAQNALTEASLAADTETGALFAQGDGSIVAYGVDYLIELLGSFGALATFGNGAGEVPFMDPVFAYDADRVYNRVSFARSGGTQQTVSDIDSRAVYGDLAYSRNDLIAESDDDVLAAATLFLARSLAPEYRVASVTVKPMRGYAQQPTTFAELAATIWYQTLFSFLYTPVTVNAMTPGGTAVSSDAYVDGVTHEISPRDWTTTFSFASREFFTTFADSVWDSATWDESRFYFG